MWQKLRQILAVILIVIGYFGKDIYHPLVRINHCNFATRHQRVHHGRIFRYTLKEKIQRVGATSSRLEFSEKLPANLSDYDFVFVDSVSCAGLKLEGMIKRKGRYQRIGFIFIFHSTKDGKSRGGNDLAHEVDVIIELEPGLTKASGRFIAGGEMRF